MERAVQVLALVALLLYLAPSVLGMMATDTRRLWLLRAAVVCLGAGLAIALVETILWFTR
jgi:hypothetical protein